MSTEKNVSLPQLHSFWLGRRGYEATHRLMQQLAEARRSNHIVDVLLLLEHEPVITLGRGASAEHILSSREQLAQLGVDLAETGRGGDVTLHAPGQLIAYPIFNLSPDRQDVRKYVQGLTQIMKELIAPFGLEGGTVSQLIGLWLDQESPAHFPGEENARALAKIGAIGVRISRWITTHGFALNLTTDLSLFGLIVPCGISQHGVTSLERMTGLRWETKEAAERTAPLFAAHFGRQAYPTPVDLSAVDTDAMQAAIMAKAGS